MNPDELKMLEMKDLIAKKEAEFDSWVEKKIGELERQRTSHSEQIAKGTEQIVQLKETEADVRKQSEAVQLEMAEENKQIDHEIEAIRNLKREEERIPKEVEQLKRDLLASQRAADEKAGVISNLESLQKQRQAELEKGVMYYASRLGLVFKRLGVKECKPMMNGTQALIQVLNRTNDFSSFVIGMRAKFRESVTKKE